MMGHFPKRGTMLFHRSRLLSFLHAVCMVFVLSYIFFDVLDLDGSNLSAVLNPTERALIAAETPAEAEAPHRPARADLWDAALIAPGPTALWAQPQNSDKLPSSP